MKTPRYTLATMKHDLEALADLMRRNAGRWMLLEDKGDRAPLALKCWRWNHEPPRVFRQGRFEFRTFKDRYTTPPRFYLEGRFLPRATFDIHPEGD